MTLEAWGGGKVVDWRNVVKKGKSEYRFVKVSVIHSRRERVEIPCRVTIEVRVKSVQDTGLLLPFSAFDECVHPIPTTHTLIPVCQTETDA